MLTWVNRPQNELIWARSYKDKAEIEPRPKSFKPPPGIKLGGNVAKIEVREAGSVFA